MPQKKKKQKNNNCNSWEKKENKLSNAQASYKVQIKISTVNLKS